jgi:stress response protein YsnF
MKENERVATVSMTKDQLKAAPEFKTLDRQQAEAEQERARQNQGTAAGSGARPTGSGATTPPPARNQ